MQIRPQYITDDTGERKLVVLSIKEFDAIMEELENIEDIKLYDEAKEEDTGERILLSDYIKSRKSYNV